MSLVKLEFSLAASLKVVSGNELNGVQNVGETNKNEFLRMCFTDKLVIKSKEQPQPHTVAALPLAWQH